MQILCFSFRTLYCAKGNYDFGISRVIKSLEPYNKKVGRLIVLTVALNDYTHHILKESCLAVIFWRYQAGQEIINTFSLKCQTWKLKLRTKNKPWALQDSSEAEQLFLGPLIRSSHNSRLRLQLSPLSSSWEHKPSSWVFPPLILTTVTTTQSRSQWKQGGVQECEAWRAASHNLTMLSELWRKTSLPRAVLCGQTMTTTYYKKQRF